MPSKSLYDLELDANWSLFLDRDGVINYRLPGDYVKTWKEFQFEDGALAAIKTFSKTFGTIVVVTNQQGIGKGLMTDADLNIVHNNMQEQILSHGGYIDNIYYSPDLRSDYPNTRKPEPAMGLQAQQDYPSIDFSKSIMVGDSISDMEFAKNLGMIAIFISSKPEDLADLNDTKNAELKDYIFGIYPSLSAVGKDIERI